MNIITSIRKRLRVPEHVDLWIGLGIFWCWCWTVIQSPREIALVVPDDGFVGARRCILAVAVLCFVGYALVRRFRSVRSPERFFAKASGTLGALVAVAVLVPRFLGTESPLVDGCELVLSGALIAVLWVGWGGLLGNEGPRQAVRYAALALLVSFLLALCVHALDPARLAVVRAVLPLLSVLLFAHARKVPGTAKDVPTTKMTKPTWKLSATLFAQGLSLGLLQTLLHSVVLVKCTATYCAWRFLYGFFGNLSMVDFCSLMSIFGLVLALALVVLSTHFLKMNFLHLIYLVGFPLIAVGFAAVACGPAFSVGSNPELFGDVFVFGEIMSTAGYYFALTVTWVLCAYLVTQKKIARDAAFVWVGFFLFAGQICGDALCQLLAALQLGSVMVCVMAIFCLLLSGLAFAMNDGIRGEWGSASPSETDQPGMFRRACQTIAETRSLTGRESEVLLLLAHGRSVEVIHEQLFISKDTVRTHVRSIYRKLGIHSRQDLLDLIDAEKTLMRDNDPS